MGSEMCIRDRQHVGGAYKVRRIAIRVVVVVERRIVLARTAGIIAVSYTHLTLPTIYSV